MVARHCIARNGRAVFYAILWDDLRQAAFKCGWALGLHGSLASDMDIMAMPWTENATTADEMIENLKRCLDDGNNPLWDIRKDTTSKPNKRVVYTLPIYADFYLDINIINTEVK